MLAEDFGEALELGRAALKRQPRNPNLLYLSWRRCRSSIASTRRARFRRAAPPRPQHLAGRKEYAVTLTRLGELDEAWRVIAALIAEQPRFADAYLVRANIRSIRGEFGPARRHSARCAAPTLTKPG